LTVQEDRCWKSQNVSEVDIAKKRTEVWCQWLTVVILATWGTEIRRIMIPGQPGKQKKEKKEREVFSHVNGEKLVMVSWACCPSYGLRWY
jgi:hypothetical protein